MVRRLLFVATGVLVFLIAAELWMAMVESPPVLQTISCPVHEAGQTPWPEIPVQCRW